MFHGCGRVAVSSLLYILSGLLVVAWERFGLLPVGLLPVVVV